MVATDDSQEHEGSAGSAPKRPGEPLEVSVPDSAAGERVDRFLAGLDDLATSRSTIQRWIEADRVYVDGRPALAKQRVTAGSTVRVEPLPEPVSDAIPEDIPLNILHLDDHVLVVDKPAGLVVHPAPGHPRGTLVNAVLFHAPGGAAGDDPLRPGIVHRLDKDTSGVMVVARSAEAKRALVAAFQARDVERRYVAIAVGAMAGPQTFCAPIGRHPTDRKRFSSRTGRGKSAVTHAAPSEALRGATLLECRLETGRTHQIRVHLADAGYPLLGDPLYGRPPRDLEVRRVSEALGRQALHAAILGFRHPIDGRPLRFETAPPDDFERARSALAG